MDATQQDARAHTSNNNQQANDSEPLPASTVVLRLRGLPFSATPDDVRAFFGDQFPVDSSPGSVVVVTQGFHRGEGYVRFVSPDVCAAAHRAMNRKHMGGRYIELYASTEGALDLQRASQAQLLSEKRFYIRMRGLPYQAGEGNVREFLAPLGHQAVLSVHMCLGPDGRFTGNVFAELASEMHVQAAMNTLNRRLMGSRYIEIFESSVLERDAAITAERRRRRPTGDHGTNGATQASHGSAASPNGFGYSSGGPQGGANGALLTQQGYPQYYVPPRPAYPVVRIRGLPFTANESTIAEFLAGVNIPAQGVHMVYNANERPTGEAFVEVCSEADVQAAVALNHQTIGRRYIEVFRSSQGEMHRLQMGEAPIPEGYYGTPGASMNQSQPPSYPPPAPPGFIGQSQLGHSMPVHPHQMQPPYQLPMMPGQPFKPQTLPLQPPSVMQQHQHHQHTQPPTRGW